MRYFKQKHKMHKFNTSAPIQHIHSDLMACSITNSNQGLDYTIKMSSVFSVSEKWKKILAICSIKLDTFCILHLLPLNRSFKQMQFFPSGLRNCQLVVVIFIYHLIRILYQVSNYDLKPLLL